MRILKDTTVFQHVKGGKTGKICTGISFILASWPAMASGTKDDFTKAKETEITVTPPSPINCLSGKEQELTVRFEDPEISRQDVGIGEARDELHDDKSGIASSSKPKKSLFEITSVINTGNDFSRGESLGNDVEDSELDDTLSETQENVGSLPTSLTNVKTGDNSQNHVSSRFRIVKILRTEPYRKGRWNCQESVDPEIKSERQSSREDTKSSAVSTLPLSSKQEQGLKPAVETNKEIVGLEHSGITGNKLDGQNTRQLGLQETLSYLQENLDRTVSNYIPQGESNSVLSSTSTATTSISQDVSGVVDHLGTRPADQANLPDSARSASTDVPVVPIVNTIETALDQITVIKSTLLTVVKTEVERLKEIILKLTAENNQLKEENERLKLLLADEGKNSHPDTARKQ